VHRPRRTRYPAAWRSAPATTRRGPPAGVCLAGLECPGTTSRLCLCRYEHGRWRWIRGSGGGATCTRLTGLTYGRGCTRRTGWRAGVVLQVILRRLSTAASRFDGESSDRQSLGVADVPPRLACRVRRDRRPQAPRPTTTRRVSRWPVMLYGSDGDVCCTPRVSLLCREVGAGTVCAQACSRRWAIW
jgi:hypothetical protein